MAIEDLQAKQREFDGWEAIVKELSVALEPALKQAPAEASRLSGLKLRSFHDPGPYMPASSGGFSVRGDRCFWLVADGADARAEVGTMPCNVAASADGHAYTYHFSNRDGDEPLGLEVTLQTPAVPLIVSHYSWKCSLWWCGPTDNHKLATAIVDALAKNVRASEITLVPIPGKGSRPSWGCLLALVAAVVLLVLVLTYG